MNDAPHAPWRLLGECVLGWARWRSGGPALPAGIARLPGPAAVVGVRYTDSPVGPYLELSVGVPARIGARPGLCVVVSVVSIPEARVGYRLNWGVPSDVGRLEWVAGGDGAAGPAGIRWLDRDIAVTAAPVGPRLPALVPVRSVQRRSDGPVVVPRRLWGLARLARTTVAVGDAGDELAGLAGGHPGALLSGMRVVAHPARRPTGVLSSLRAPLRAPEPALAGEALE